MKAFVFYVLLMVSGCSATGDFRQVADYYGKTPTEQSALNLPFDAYIVGLDKASQNKVGVIKECSAAHESTNCLDVDQKYFSDHPEIQSAFKEKYRTQMKSIYVSHIAKFDGGSGPCYVYNLYSDAHGCARRYVPHPGETVVDAGWPALGALGQDIGAYIQEKHPTHLVVYTMGWNTLQAEAMDNFRELALNLKAAAENDKSFIPLIIGVTWPSTGTPIIGGTDFGIKAGDAEEVGSIWENILINRELRMLKAQANFKVIVIGHSFGARASSRAVFSRALVTSDTQKTVDLLIGLQGAYSYQRYGKYADEDPINGREGAPYRDFSDMVGLSVLTASRFDSAVTRACHNDYFVGSYAAMNLSRGRQHGQTFAYDETNESGRLSGYPCDSQRVLYVDASSIINGHKDGTMGGAHSMIYSPQMGNFVYQLIHACAP